MSTNDPKITVIIPTRDRIETLVHTIKTVQAVDCPKLEILVCDNNSHDETGTIITSIKDTRLRYIHSNTRLSMTDNWEFALSHSTGDYIIIIGDDDAIIPENFKFLQKCIVDKKYPHFVKWKTGTYVWPIEQKPASVEVRNLNSNVVKPLDSRLAVKKVLTNGGWQYYNLPSFYHAAVSKKLIETIRNKHGRVFNTTQPDLYSSIIVSANSEFGYFLGKSITMHGKSAKSNGGSDLTSNGVLVRKTTEAEYGNYLVNESLQIECLPSSAQWTMDGLICGYLREKEIIDVDFNYSAMWAFVSRIGFISPVAPLLNANKIKRKHKFSRRVYSFYMLVHTILKIRAALRGKFNVSSRKIPDIPANIYDYIKYSGG